MYFLLLLALLILPVFIVLGSLRPAQRRGQAVPHEEDRRTREGITNAILLNLVCIPLPFLLFVGFGLLIVPATFFGIAASVAGHAGRRPILFGLLSCPWFPLPLLLYWGLISMPTDIAKFAGIGEEGVNKPAFILLWFTWWGVGLIGAGAAAWILRIRGPIENFPAQT